MKVDAQGRLVGPSGQPVAVGEGEVEAELGE